MQISKNKFVKFLALLIIVAILSVIAFYLPEELRANDRFLRYALIGILFVFGLVYIFVDIAKIYKIPTLVAIFMVGFAFISVPMYNTFCDVTGINGKLDLSVTAGNPKGVDYDRKVVVEFVVNHNEDMPWQFSQQNNSLTMHPGALSSTGYYAKNNTKNTMIAQAVPSIMPAKAAKYFKKIECFCFSSQQLGPGESRNLPLRFYLDPDLPKDVHRITLAYTIFDVTNDPDLQKRHGNHP